MDFSERATGVKEMIKFGLKSEYRWKTDGLFSCLGSGTGKVDRIGPARLLSQYKSMKPLSSFRD